jgi:hypothetical protein
MARSRGVSVAEPEELLGRNTTGMDRDKPVTGMYDLEATHGHGLLTEDMQGHTSSSHACHGC